MLTHDGHYFKKAAHIIDQRMRGASGNLTSGQCFLLKYLTNHGGSCFQNELESIFGFRRSTGSTFIAILERDGYIIRLPSEDDKRVKKIEITEKGRRRLEAVDTALEEIEEKMTENIPEDDLIVFEMVSKRMIGNLREDGNK